MSADSRVRNYRPLREAILDSMKQVLVALRPELMAQRTFHSIDRTVKDRADRTRTIDVAALDIYTVDLQKRLPGTSALVCSEENPGGTTLTNSPELPNLLFIIDPIDNTDGAIHGSPCYTALSVYLRSCSTAIAAAVGDFFQKLSGKKSYTFVKGDLKHGDADHVFGRSGQYFKVFG
jgi:fructose-1,6-bisphosphatase/inositol monophosphatase family enzyme